MNMFDRCVASTKIPKESRKTKIIAHLKPGNGPSTPRNYRSISLHCHTLNLFEHLIRVTPLLMTVHFPNRRALYQERPALVSS